MTPAPEPEQIEAARKWLYLRSTDDIRESALNFHAEQLAAYAAHCIAEATAEKDAEIVRLSHELVEAEGALWRIFPNTHTIEYEGSSQKADPFEGSGETYHDAYLRVSARLAKLEAVAEAARDLSKAFRDDICRRDHHGYCQSHFLEEDCSKGSRVERLLKALSALEGEKE